MKRSILGVAALLVFLGVPGQARAGLILDFTGGLETGPGSQARVFGWRFTVTSPITADGLGFWDDDANGLALDHQVGLWTGDGSSLLASTTITNASTRVKSTSTEGRWLFNDIAPLTLLPGDYVLGATYQGNDTDRSRSAFVNIATIPEVTYRGPRRAQASTLAFPSEDPGVATGYFGPNLRASPAQVVPEPASLTLLGIGAVALFGYGWRRRRRAAARRRGTAGEGPASRV
jgi:hypothetical protein